MEQQMVKEKNMGNEVAVQKKQILREALEK